MEAQTIEERALSKNEIKESLPENYALIRLLTSGGFGQVYKCRRKDTREIVAVKVPLYQQDTEEEIRLLSHFRDKGLDQNHIVKFFEAFDTRLGKAMVFEMLDMDLLCYYARFDPIPISDIRTIVKQVAMALEVLKDMSIIHGDIKMNNVMVCDSTQRPLHVKLIDFGLSLPTSRARQGTDMAQPVSFRPPEILLGLPFDESLDVWCLGNMMAFMMLRLFLCPNSSEYDTLKILVKLFGMPSQAMLDRGMRTDEFFTRVDNSWIMMIDLLDMWECSKKYFTERFTSLEELIQCVYEINVLEYDAEAQEATSLLSRMLEMRVEDRITPSQILQHPFIRGTVEETMDEEGESVRVKEEEEDEEQVDPVQTTPSKSPTIIFVKPASPENTSPFNECEPSERLESEKSQTPDAVEKVEPEQNETVSSVISEKDNQKCDGPKKDKRTWRWKNQVAPVSTSPNKEATKPKKKNCFQRIFSWVKRLNCFTQES